MSTDQTNTTTAPTSTAGALPLRPGHWTLDPAHSSITFSIRHLGLSRVRGRFDRLDVGETLATTRVLASIGTASIDTGNAERDEHLRADDFLDVGRYPEMTFASTAITGAGQDWHMAGELTVLGRTRPFDLDVELHGVQPAIVYDANHAGFGASGQILRDDLGLRVELPPGGGILLGDVVSFELDLQFVEPSD